ncbi:MAG: ABC transporter substrate-binding protein, partial [Gammaproteobacteria bacterium]
MSKRNMFIAILIMIGLLGTVASMVAKVTFLDRPEGKPFHIALVIPQSGVNVGMGKSMRNGLQLALDQLNSHGGIDDRPVDLVVFDEKDVGGLDSDFGKAVTADKEMVAIVGPWSGDKLDEVAEVANNRSLPVIVPSSVNLESVTEHRNVFATLFDVVWQTRFLANYNRNVVGEKTASVIYEDNDQGRLLFDQFDKTYRRFGTRVLNSWAYDASDPDTIRKRATPLAEEIKDKKLSGTIFIQGNVTNTAAILVALRDQGVRNPVIGLSEMATSSFRLEVTRFAAPGKTAADYLNGTMVTTPLLFDTATEVAQTFRSAYVDAHGVAPDWPAAFSFDAGQLAIEAMKDLLRDMRKASDEDLAKATKASSMAATIYDHLSEMNRPEEAQPAAGGMIYFENGGQSAMPVQMGLYNGASMISALTQLQPITEGGVSGYLDLLKQGKVLYVNDGFMYRTNVVYTGVQLQDVQELDVNANTVKLTFLIWFRYRGDFSPEDIVFENSLQPIDMGEPIRQGKSGDMIYKAFRVEGVFNLNFTLVEREYGSELVGLSFHHRVLSKNNLMYVTDVLGMGLAENNTLLSTLQENVTGEGGVGEAEGDEVGRLADLAETLG